MFTFKIDYAFKYPRTSHKEFIDTFVTRHSTNFACKIKMICEPFLQITSLRIDKKQPF
jgi:hypothetical protein